MKVLVDISGGQRGDGSFMGSGAVTLSGTVYRFTFHVSEPDSGSAYYSIRDPGRTWEHRSSSSIFVESDDSIELRTQDVAWIMPLARSATRALVRTCQSGEEWADFFSRDGILRRKGYRSKPHRCDSITLSFAFRTRKKHKKKRRVPPA